MCGHFVLFFCCRFDIPASPFPAQGEKERFGLEKQMVESIIYHMDKEKNQLKYGALISYIAIFINTATALVYLPWMARKLGRSDYALYNLAYSFVNFFLVDIKVLIVF